MLHFGLDDYCSSSSSVMNRTPIQNRIGYTYRERERVMPRPFSLNSHYYVYLVHHHKFRSSALQLHHLHVFDLSCPLLIPLTHLQTTRIFACYSLSVTIKYKRESKEVLCAVKFKIDEYLHESNLQEYAGMKLSSYGEEFSFSCSLIKDCSIRSCIIILFTNNER